MKATCEKDSLLEAVRLAERATGKNLPLAVLSAVLITADGNTLSVRGTNLDLGIEVTVPAKIETNGSVAVSGSLLQQLLGGIPSGETVSLTHTDSGLHVAGTSHSATLTTQAHDDFPTLPQVSDGSQVALPAGDVAVGLRSVAYSASQSTIKPELNSVYVATPETNTLVTAATDSFRLAEKRLSVSKLDTFNPILVPVKNVPDILQVLERADGDVTVSVSNNQLAMTIDRVYVTTRLVDGTFPDYKQIIPTEHTTEVVVLKQDVLQTLKTANVFLDKFSRLGITVSPKKGTFSLHTHNADTGSYTANLDASLSGDEVDMEFNHRYIFDCFQSIPTDSVVFHFSGAGKPLIIRGVSDPSFLYLVMPMNT